jgi:hypothetical protein
MTTLPMVQMLREDIGENSIGDDDSAFMEPMVGKEILEWNRKVDIAINNVDDLDIEPIPFEAAELCFNPPYSYLWTLQLLDYVGRTRSYYLLQHHVNNLLVAGTFTLDGLVKQSESEEAQGGGGPFKRR